MALCVLLLALLQTLRAPAAPPKLPLVPAKQVGMDGKQLRRIDELVAHALADGKMPGCVITIARHGKICFQKAYGHREVQPSKQPMTVDTVFDLASLTKPVATATSIMVLLERGDIRLRSKVADDLPAFAAGGKEAITVKQLLVHQSGLAPFLPIERTTDSAEAGWQAMFEAPPRHEPGTKFVYSDINFLMLGRLVEEASGKSLREFSQQCIFGPLGMMETGFLPREDLRKRAAVTEQRDGEWMRGQVHDPRAHFLGGVAGHAGLFSTAADLAVYADMLLGEGRYRSARIVSPQTVRLMTSAFEVSRGHRGLGWDKQSPYSSNRPELMSQRAFGHGGFTGTAMWIDPELDLAVIFLSNRVHPDGKGSVNDLAGRIGAVAVAAIRKPTSTRRPQPGARDTRSNVSVQNGIDVLQQDGFKQLAGRRVGLITNHTGHNRDRISTVQLLAEAPGVELVALFSPEHGFAGKLEHSRIASGRDTATGLVIHSLYGATRQPTAKMLAGMDTLVFDIQDIGTRFYTYVSTMGLAMEAAAEHGLKFVVLDRVNPIGGLAVQGPVLDAGKESFVGFHPIAVRHGMTVGELAKMFQSERKLNCDLDVIPIKGWRREMFFDATRLPWTNPSPNMRSLAQALLYPGIGLLETTNLSVGRGTDTPFEVLGAPWLDGRRLAAAMHRASLPGVTFVPIEFTPAASKYEQQKCSGINLLVTDRRQFQPVRTGLAIAHQLHRLYSDEWDAANYPRLLGSEAVVRGLLEGESVRKLEASYSKQLAQFKRRRQQFLIYR